MDGITCDDPIMQEEIFGPRLPAPEKTTRCNPPPAYPP